MEKEQIFKALECCTRGRKSNEDVPCPECPYNECNIVGGTRERQTSGTCQSWLMKDALAIIKELTEECEKLKSIGISKDIVIESLAEENEKLKSENAKYEAENHSEFNKWLKLEEATKRRHSELFEEAKIAIREGTVREMQENLDELLHTVPTVYNSHFHRLISYVVERMLKENDEKDN